MKTALRGKSREVLEKAYEALHLSRQGLTYREIGERLKINRGYAHTLVERAERHEKWSAMRDDGISELYYALIRGTATADQQRRAAEILERRLNETAPLKYDSGNCGSNQPKT